MLVIDIKVELTLCSLLLYIMLHAYCSELFSERKLLDTSRQQSDKLASKVDELEFQMDQMQHEKNKVRVSLCTMYIKGYIL